MICSLKEYISNARVWIYDHFPLVVPIIITIVVVCVFMACVAPKYTTDIVVDSNSIIVNFDSYHSTNIVYFKDMGGNAYCWRVENPYNSDILKSEDEFVVEYWTMGDDLRHVTTITNRNQQ